MKHMTEEEPGEVSAVGQGRSQVSREVQPEKGLAVCGGQKGGLLPEGSGESPRNQDNSIFGSASLLG